MLNRVVLSGRLTRDPELRYTPNGVAVANFNIAVNRAFSNADGNREADFIDCVAWKKNAENLANFMRKGNQIGVDGRLQTRRYEDKDGKMVYVTEVVAEQVAFLEPKNSGAGNGNSGQSQQQSNTGGQYQSQQSNQNQQNQQYQQNQQTQGQNNDPFAGEGTAIDISDDDLPF